LVRTYPPDPLPLLREGGIWIREGLRPSLKLLPFSPAQGKILKESQREASPLLHTQSPSLVREGDKGGRLLTNICKAYNEIRNSKHETINKFKILITET